MDLPDAFYRFVAEHLSDDVCRLRLKHWPKLSFDVSFAIGQIEARQKIRTKLPTWHANRKLLFPAKICAEQASSEETAAYKSRLVAGGSLCDLTGGLGIDSFYFSRKAAPTVYVERFSDYCRVAGHNFAELQVDVQVVNDDAAHFLDNTVQTFDTVYLDPARRGTENRRLFSLEDCEPNVLELLPKLKAKSRTVLLKISPMADITHTLGMVPGCTAVHVLSVRNECKELLLVLDRDTTPDTPEVICADLGYSEREVPPFRFGLSEERLLPPPSYATKIRRYLYEPNASLLKAGAFKLIAQRFGLQKLDPSSHLYTSDEWLPAFPGRGFRVSETLSFTPKNLKRVALSYPAAHVTARNFPLTVDAFRKKSRIVEGGDRYLFCTTLHPQQRIVVVCEKP